MTQQQVVTLLAYRDKHVVFTCCGARVRRDGENVQFKRDYDRQGRSIWSVRCKPCNRDLAREGMARMRRLRR